MSLTLYVLLAIAFAVTTFFIANVQKARAMGLSQILDFAVKVHATEVRLQVGERVEFVTPEGVRTLFGSTLKASDFERQMVERLPAAARLELAAKGRCDWSFDEKAVGRVRAEVEPRRARLTMPHKPRKA